MLDKNKVNLIKRAIKKYRVIFPVSRRRTINQCFSRSGKRLIFWFNTADDSTHIEQTVIRRKQPKRKNRHRLKITSGSKISG